MITTETHLNQNCLFVKLPDGMVVNLAHYVSFEFKMRYGQEICHAAYADPSVYDTYDGKRAQALKKAIEKLVLVDASESDKD